MSVADNRVAASPATVLIADDHALVRQGMKTLVAGLLGEVRFVEAGDVGSLLRAASAHPATRLALIDLDMPGMHDAVPLLELSRQHPTLPLIVLSSMTSATIQRRILSIDAVHAFLAKSCDIATAHRAIAAALRGQRSPMQPAKREPAAPLIAELTPRRQEICLLLRQGMTNKKIASTLGISTGTVKNHITEIFKVLNATNRAQVAGRRDA